MDHLNLGGSSYLITGGGSGIGRATAEIAAARGARVAVADVDRHAAQEAASSLPGRGHRAVAVDVADPDSVAAMADTLSGWTDRLAAAVFAAGIAQPRRLAAITPDDLRRTFAVNVFGAVYCAQATAPLLTGGAVVLLGSVAAERGGGLFGGPHYAASKAALSGLTRALARELAASEIRVNCVAPGPTDTPILAGLDAAAKAAIADRVLAGRMGTPQEVAEAVAWLAGPGASFVTGAVLPVTGGGHFC